MFDQNEAAMSVRVRVRFRVRSSFVRVRAGNLSLIRESNFVTVVCD